MIAKFKSIDKEGNVIEFESDCSYENGIFTFKDQSIENTMIHLTYDSNSVSILRNGDTKMDLNLIYKQKTSGYYENNLGLKFEFYSFTNDLSVNSNQIYVSYSLFIENDMINEHKIWILFN